MYINPFIAGAVFTIFFELLLIFGMAVIYVWRHNDDD